MLIQPTILSATIRRDKSTKDMARMYLEPLRK
jgi:hypothetical protein